MQDFQMHHGVRTIHFEIILSEGNLMIAKEEGLLKKFKLNSTFSTSNMHLFDERGLIKKYDSPEQSKYFFLEKTVRISPIHQLFSNNSYLSAVLEEFFPLRLEYYSKRRVGYNLTCFSFLFSFVFN